MQAIKKIDSLDLEIKVKKMYTEVALNPKANYHFELGRELALKLGYSEDILNQIPSPAVDSFAGVGFHFDLYKIKKGDKVLDLGSGSGTDLFYSAILVGPEGSVTGVDMTQDQIDKSIRLAEEHNFLNVQVVKSYIEKLPFPDNSFDVIISNGVINLSANKEQTISEISRVLKPGGALIFSDIISLEQMPESIVCNATLWASCIGGATQIDTLMDYFEANGLFVKTQKFNNQYSFLSKSALGASSNYGVQSHSFYVIKPILNNTI